MQTSHKNTFPIGASISEAELHDDPYAVYAKLRDREPVSWLPIHNMFYITRHDLCKAILTDDEGFSVGFEHSTVFDILGSHMMSVDGAPARRLKNAHRKPFAKRAIVEGLQERIIRQVDLLIDGFVDQGKVELASQFASRLPILIMLDFFGLPASDEAKFRGWYNAFESGLANNAWDEDIRVAGKAAVADYHLYMQDAIDATRANGKQNGLLYDLINARQEKRLSDSEIAYNSSIILFGGISTVEALILNAIYALSINPEILDKVRVDRSLLDKTIEETIRWAGPVQSAHRQVTKPVEVDGVELPQGATVSCVLAAANHDPAVFAAPEKFDINRDTRGHIAFAAGQHLCLGMHLARIEGVIALDRLLERLDGFCMDAGNPGKPVGSEFHQPKQLFAVWRV